jgi:hypothetical protein
MEPNHIELLAIWLHSAARRDGQLDSFRRVIRLAAEDAADTYADDDFLTVREVIGRFAAAVDELERQSVSEEREGVVSREYVGVVRGTGNVTVHGLSGSA